MTVQEKVTHIIELAKELNRCNIDPLYLFEKVNSIPEKEITALLNVYNEESYYSNGKLSPVNLLRHHILLMLSEGKELSSDEVDRIKNRFVKRDIDFFSGYNEEVKKAIAEYPIGKRTPFHVWKEPYRILYTFFFYGSKKDTMNKYLDDITKEILNTLGVKDFSVHYVNFDGSNNFGSDYCWFSLYPDYKLKHTNAIQLFARITAQGFLYGPNKGSEIKKLVDDASDFELTFELETSNNLDDVIDSFKNILPKVQEMNSSIKQFWKYAPGKQGKYWNEMREKGIMAIGWDDLGDLNQYPDRDAIGEALNVSPNSNESWNCDLFRNASINDVVVASKGRKVILGIGVIAGDYTFDESRKFFKHVRNVKWIITEPIESDITLFRADTFSPTLKYNEIKKLYQDKYPALVDKLNQIDGGISTGEISDNGYLSDTDCNYFWMNASPKIWNYSDINVGETINYTTHNERGNKRRIYDYFQRAVPGDQVIGYVSSPIKQITALLEVSKSLYTNEQEGEVVEFRINEFLENPIDYEILKETDELKKAEPMINNQGSLFALSEEEYNTILDIISNVSPLGISDKIFKKYTLSEALEESGLSEDVFTRYISIIEQKKQAIFQGPPGTGKTYIADIIARYLTQKKDNIEIVQFHPSYSYEDFVEGYRPVETGGLKVKNGIFKELCRKAEINKDEKYVIIIDEINRGDISKIFGELIFLLEYRDKAVKLTYNPELTFRIPSNLYIIGTMNMADRSLALMDYALRRRFSFITLETDYDIILRMNKDSSFDIKRLVKNIQEINDRITSTPSLGQDFIIGHSYFIGNDANPLKIDTIKDLEWLWDYELRPLLLEYYFDNTQEVKTFKDILFKDVTN